MEFKKGDLVSWTDHTMTTPKQFREAAIGYVIEEGRPRPGWKEAKRYKVRWLGHNEGSVGWCDRNNLVLIQRAQQE